MNTAHEHERVHVKTLPFGVRTKLLGIAFLAVASALILIVLQVDREADQAANQAVKESLDRFREIIQKTLDQRFRVAHDTATMIAADSRVFPLVYAGDSSSLMDVCDEWQLRNGGPDLLMFTDANGTILARTNRPELIGANIAGRSALFDTAIAGEPAQGFMRIESRLLQIAAVPIIDNAAPDVVRGTAAVARELTAEMASDIRNLTGCDVAVFSLYQRDSDEQRPPVRLFGTSPDKAVSTKIMSFLPWSMRFDGMVLDVNGELYNAVAHALDRSDGVPLGTAVAYRSRSELTAPFDRIRHSAMLFAVVLAVAAGALAFVMTGHISRPIIHLSEVARAIEDGDYPDDFSTGRRDEIGVLINAVNQMGVKLKEKDMLEAYLTEITEPSIHSEKDLDLYRDVTTIQRRTTQHESGNKTYLPPDTVLADRFAVIHPLGTGATGVVYLAYDTTLDEDVALKIFNNTAIIEQDADLLMRELRLTRSISHRNVVRTHDIYNHDGVMFIAMEYVSGSNLAQLLQRHGRLDIVKGVILVKQLCAAIGAAHAEGIIHCDLKPQNVMINRRGILKITDFGIAQRLRRRRERSYATGSGDHGATTEEGDTEYGVAEGIMGTPQYMAPEQFMLDNIDQRTDIYALGVIMFELFAGQVPFDGDTLRTLARQHCYDAPPRLRSRLQHVPAALDDLVHKALQKDMNDRFRSVNELHERLATIMFDGMGMSRTTRRRQGRDTRRMT